MFGVSKGTIYRLIKKNTIHSVNLGESRVKSYGKLQYNADLVNKRIKNIQKMQVSFYASKRAMKQSEISLYLPYSPIKYLPYARK
ncbi:hypothetical protein ACFFUE_03085 [Bergeyella porcorum]|uniref:hypothetical protein n=1 Tax=Bergeyella porcorum TaxID=1735111 RepID=UPI0035E8B0C8